MWKKVIINKLETKSIKRAIFPIFKGNSNINFKIKDLEGMTQTTNTKTNSIMAHHIIGYPNLAESYTIAQEYITAGIEILELQIPFSHPTADGATLTDANQKAVENGITLDNCFDFYKTISQQAPDTPIIAMSYLNRLFSYGIAAFCDKLATSGVYEIIIPDLPFDSPTAKAILDHEQVNLVPVIAPNLSDKRLNQMLQLQPNYIYMMSGFSTTGQGFELHPNAQNIIEQIQTKTSAKIGIGFGISKGEEVKAVNRIADFAIVGSALKIAIDESTIQEKLNDLLSA